jgi:peroxiredoxin Q/BCP
MAKLEEGMKAPSFSLKDTYGKIVKLSDFKGKKVILYFYPKDDTPGCTVEACAFRDDITPYKKKGAVILGVSKDDAESHQKFTAKFKLNFPLLSDIDTKVCQAYGVWGKGFMGHFGIIRSTFVIDEKGLIMKAMYRVNPVGHSSDLLKLLD